jgi:hypothetical protein
MLCCCCCSCDGGRSPQGFNGLRKDLGLQRFVFVGHR